MTLWFFHVTSKHFSIFHVDLLLIICFMLIIYTSHPSAFFVLYFIWIYLFIYFFSFFFFFNILRIFFFPFSSLCLFFFSRHLSRFLDFHVDLLVCLIISLLGKILSRDVLENTPLSAIKFRNSYITSGLMILAGSNVQPLTIFRLCNRLFLASMSIFS